ncbi:MAG: hypothetical protein A2161_15505 [Candidatus Schekmanbacteria bacterium RBG_13_48_7]|uniref:Transposase IS4-like domain-containing protein n=1 Tax=Candidatus Schekmanbacteria bacterium RBG_13_48_7 TaxID=1817878 RepID=A0A1F7RNH7_9BACT|nr:MAG: hypothetical protein A2161_15505 [Candidatus Schekmanbacteria bacterium RBG_13_48_7]
MVDDTRIRGKIKAQISKFSGIISQAFSKPKRKLIKEVHYGIQASKDVKLSNISRTLNEDIDLIKTENRLSSSLDCVDFTDGINDQICRLASNKVLDEMVIAIDDGDIRKKYAQHMENLAGIHDGNEHEVGNGYWLCKAVAADLEHKTVIPLYCEAYSQKAKDFKSVHNQRFKLIEKVSEHIGDKGIWAMDRGGDNNKLFYKFLDNKKRFVIRLQKKRNLVHKGTVKNCYELAKFLPCPFEAKIIKYEDGKENSIIISYNAVPVKLPKRKEKLFLIVVKGFGKEPMMLLTSCRVHLQVKESIWRITEIYLTRWKCEESFRYIKQSYNLEDLRVRSYIRIRNIVVLVLAVSYFAAVYLGQNLKLKILVERIYVISKRFFGIPSFFNYAIADGLYNLLFPDKTGITHTRGNESGDDFQLCFDFGFDP